MMEEVIIRNEQVKQLTGNEQVNMKYSTINLSHVNISNMSQYRQAVIRSIEHIDKSFFFAILNEKMTKYIIFGTYNEFIDDLYKLNEDDIDYNHICIMYVKMTY